MQKENLYVFQDISFIDKFSFSDTTFGRLNIYIKKPLKQMDNWNKIQTIE